jgi:putative ABC transport system substrate-binding protein
MWRRDFVLLVSATLAASANARAQSPDRVRHIGVLIYGSAPHKLPEALNRHLTEHGYVEGRNVQYEVRYADGRVDRAAMHAVELVRLKPDVIVAHFTPAVRAVKDATSTIPTVMAPAGAPVEVGLVASLARPGGNITGVSSMDAELGGKRLQVLKEIIPRLGHVAVLASIQDPFTKPFLHYMKETAPGIAVRLEPAMVTGPADFPDAFAAMARDGAQAVVIQGVFNSDRRLIVELAQWHHLAVMSFDRETTAAGGLVSLTTDRPEIYRRAAGAVARILRGANPADLPVEQPTTFELVINLKSAQMLGLTIPPSLLLSADEVIE